MTRFGLNRLFGAVLVMLGASLLTFLLMDLAPGDALLAIAKARFGDTVSLDQSALDAIRAEAGLDRPFLTRYAAWLINLVQLDLGNSLIDGRPVLDIIAERFQRTAELALGAIAVAALLSVPLGLMAGLFHGTWFDSLCVSLATLGSAMPNYWLGILFILFFSVWLGVLPAFGRGDLDHLVLPALTLGTGVAVTTARLLRSATIEAMAASHIDAARGRGLSEARIVGRHAVRNALVPVVTVFALEIAFLLEGAVAVEYVFGWHGLGLLFVEAVDARDYPVIQAVVLVFAMLFVAINLWVDLLTFWLDPRTRAGAA
ncbi:MAG: ABC transporter permease [Pseudomonadota bacterium]